jgi:capsular polysaccharide biosynthesis protein
VEPSGVADWQTIEAAAAENGMEVVHPAALSLADRLHLFGEADCLLGFDGAVLREACVHASPGIPICVVRGGLSSGAGTAALALALGHQVGVVFGGADEQDPLAPAVIEAEDRQNALTCLGLMKRRLL